MKAYDLITSGYPSLDHIIKTNTTLEIGKTSLIKNDDFNKTLYGGCNVNVSINLARLGYICTPILRVGKDFKSSGFKKFLVDNGVCIDAISKLSTYKTSSTFIIEIQKHEHVTLFYPGAMDEKLFKSYNDEWFQNAKCALITVASQRDNEEFLKHVKNNQIPLFLGMKMDSDAFPKPFLKTCLEQTHTLFANNSEATCIMDLLGIKKIEDIFSTLPLLKQVIITKGCNGSSAYIRNKELIEKLDITIVKTKTVLDTVGSGDAYIAGFIYGYLNKMSVKDSMRYGSVLASFVIEGVGATSISPTKTALIKRYKQNYS